MQLLDFGATRYYEPSFIEQWYQLLQAAIDEDRERCTSWSLELGYLIGQESEVSESFRQLAKSLINVKVMVNSHIDSMVLLASPFRREIEQPYSFEPGSEWSEITARIRATIPIMLRERLTPPPRETYSLNRRVRCLLSLLSLTSGQEIKWRIPTRIPSSCTSRLQENLV